MIEPEDRWEQGWAEVRITDGPIRIYDNNPLPDLVRRPVGFAPVVREQEPTSLGGRQRMTTTKTRRCRVYGAPLESVSRSARKCGRCARKRIDAAHAGHVYQRVHVHIAEDGSKTIEYGTTCECQEGK